MMIVPTGLSGAASVIQHDLDNDASAKRVVLSIYHRIFIDRLIKACTGGPRGWVLFQDTTKKLVDSFLI